MSRAAVGGGAATLSIAGLTWKRLRRGRAIWVSVLLSAVPVMMSNLISGNDHANGINDVLAVSILLLAIVPSLHIASSLSEELEERTAAYLWSRPIPRWTIVSGKMLALVPFVAALSIAGAIGAAYNIGAVGVTLEIDRAVIGLGLGVLAVSCCAVGIATIATKHGAPISMVYLMAVDHSIGLVDASLANLSITRHVRDIVYMYGSVSAKPIIGLLAISLVWLVVALTRIRRLE
jgi:ABC-type transport system involved in multi-copper enzyme maturation permease subunit